VRRVFKGVVKNGVIVLEGDGQLPDGTKVTVIVEEATQPTQTVWEVLKSLVGISRSGLGNVSERKDEYVAEAIEHHWRQSTGGEKHAGTRKELGRRGSCRAKLVLNRGEREMRQVFKGVVKNGVIVLEGNGHLPDGTKVTVIVEETTIRPTNWEQLEKIVGLFDSGLSDVSERKHEYLAEAFYRCGETEPREGETS